MPVEAGANGLRSRHNGPLLYLLAIALGARIAGEKTSDEGVPAAQVIDCLESTWRPPNVFPASNLAHHFFRVIPIQRTEEVFLEGHEHGIFADRCR